MVATTLDYLVLLWKLQPGRQVIRVVDNSGRADTRQITVTAVE
jgi:hypothetical protein